jgi:hypothetical protein
MLTLRMLHCIVVPSAPVKSEQQETIQAYSAMKRVIHRHGSIEARHLQAIEQKRQNFHQRMEHQTTMSLFPLKPRGSVNCFAIP